MRLLISILIFFLLLPLSAHSNQVGLPAPVFDLKDAEGRKVSLEDYKGKVLFLDFWAPWCIPCKEELPALEWLYRKYNQEGLEIIAVAVESTGESVSRFLQRIEVSYPVVLDSKGTASEAYRCSHMPTGYIIGRDGIIRYIHKGFGRVFCQCMKKKS